MPIDQDEKGNSTQRRRRERDSKKSLDNQVDLPKAMRETARTQDEQHSDVYRDKFRFLVESLKSEIRYYFDALEEFIDLPQEVNQQSQQRKWAHCARDMENAIQSIIVVPSDQPSHSLDAILTLLNYRDAAVSLLMNGLLFQAAVLHWEMQSGRSYTEGPMAEMSELVVNMVSKTETVPHRLEAYPPSISDVGPFSFDQKRATEKGALSTNELSPLQCRLLTLLREMQQLDKGLRNMKFGQQVTVPDDRHRGGNLTKIVAADALRGEITKWHQKCMKLEKIVEASKASRHSSYEQQVEQLTAKVEEKEKQYRQQVQFRSKLESDLNNKQYENNNLKREKIELADKNAKMMKDTIPVIAAIEKLQRQSKETVDRLNADAELLSSMFQIQVHENNKNVAERNNISKELTTVHQQLKRERFQSQFKEDELQKKETLYQRTVAARKSVHESYLEQKAKIIEVEAKMGKREQEWQEMLKVLEGKDSDISNLKADMKRATQRIDELEQQKKVILSEFRKATGRSCNALLEGFKSTPPISSSEFEA